MNGDVEARAATVMERCERLATISEETGAITRPYGSRAMREANDVVAGWMHDAGMETREDAVGNLIGFYEGAGEKTLVLGSHLDTVRDAGRYDGILGVMVALACVKGLRDRDEPLPYSIEVAAFADEEGLRFGTTFFGSSVYAGTFEEEILDLTDADGVTLSRAVREFGGDPEALGSCGRKKEDLLGYCEVHIEQGPVLEKKDLPVGVVTAINGQSRLRVGFSGEAGHAGTVPMEERRDALCAAAEFVLEVEAAAKSEPGTVATVGEIVARPGASNVVPGEVECSLDLRRPDDATRERLRDHLEQRSQEIAASRGCRRGWQMRQETPAVRTDVRLTELLGEAVRDAGLDVHALPSGAGHDAAELAALAPVAMLFVRCEKGISHNPAESVEEGDMIAAIRVMDLLLALLAEHVRSGGPERSREPSP